MEDNLKYSLLRIAYEPALVLSVCMGRTGRIVDRELPGIDVLQRLGCITIKNYTSSYVVTRAWLTKLGESVVNEISPIECVHIMLEHVDCVYNRSLLRHYIAQLSLEELPIFLVSADEFIRNMAKAVYDKRSNL